MGSSNTADTNTNTMKSGKIRELAKTYRPEEVEERIYRMWLKGNYFHARVNYEKKPYTIMMPPPNVTGQLHMGHALDNTLQDTIIRFRRMQGYEALWQPGCDHAAIATEVKVTEKLKESGIDKLELGREGFLKEAWKWKEEYEGRIVNQLHKLGSSADWERLRFTMDEGCSEAVKTVFLRLYEKGLIYKGSRIINYCPVCHTSLSDAEVIHEEQDGFFWHINYPIIGEEGKFVEIATTRPETMLGDTAVAVNPDDSRYQNLIGKELELPLTGRKIPVIADSYVDPEFGTGCVKITPAHDPNDFEVGKRHGLPEINILNDNAAIICPDTRYDGMDRYEARKEIVKDLKDLGLLVKTVPHKHNVGIHDRCGTTVEPLIKPQWFVKMEELAKPAIRAVETGELKFVPDNYSKTYLHWLENIKDWCISRQLWWGHRIPAYYCDKCGEMVVAEEMPSCCPRCGASHSFTQDPDTLDTWFSSALWPFETLGWPEETEDYRYFYPTDVLVTGYDIIFFWVVRMVFSGIEHTGSVPFRNVLIHGLVRDELGRKMSKSLGNGIDPLEVVQKYGADALRMTLLTGNAPGNDMRFQWSKVEASRNFMNKLWNASRFIFMNLGDELARVHIGDDLAGKPIDLALDNNLDLEQDLEKNTDLILDIDTASDNDLDSALDNDLVLTSADRWILSRLNNVVMDVTRNMEAFDLGIALDKIQSFLWDEFCDWYIEMVKPRLYNNSAKSIKSDSSDGFGSTDSTGNSGSLGNSDDSGSFGSSDGFGSSDRDGGADEGAKGKASALWTLCKVLVTSLKLLHPFCPFVTEEIYDTFLSELNKEFHPLMLSSWPVWDKAFDYPEEEAEIEAVKEAVRAIRAIRTEMKVPMTRRSRIYVSSSSETVRARFAHSKVFFKTLSFASDVVIQEGKEGIDEDAVSVVVPDATIYMPFRDLVDVKKELERLQREKERLNKEISRGKGMLGNARFVEKAPESKVNEERDKLKRNEEMLLNVEERLLQLQKI